MSGDYKFGGNADEQFINDLFADKINDLFADKKALLDEFDAHTRQGLDNLKATLDGEDPLWWIEGIEVEGHDF